MRAGRGGVRRPPALRLRIPRDPSRPESLLRNHLPGGSADEGKSEMLGTPCEMLEGALTGELLVLGLGMGDVGLAVLE